MRLTANVLTLWVSVLYRNLAMRLTACALGFTQADSISAEIEKEPRYPKVYQALRSANGQVVLELRGPEDNVPLEARVILPPSKKRIFLAHPETAITYGEISADGRCIALGYHVSSGGDGEGFVRNRHGVYWSEVAIDDPDRWLERGAIEGLDRQDMPDSHQSGPFHRLSLLSNPNRFVFDIGWGALRLIYSVDEHQVVAWERRVLTGHGSQPIDLRELSGGRGFVLMAADREEAGTPGSTLVTFPAKELDRRAMEIRLRKVTGRGQEVNLVATFDHQGIDDSDHYEDGNAIWKVKLSGRGKAYDSLVARLSGSVTSDGTVRTPVDGWNEYEAVGKTPDGYVAPPGSAPENSSGEPEQDAEAARAAEIKKAADDRMKAALQRGDYRELEKLLR